MNNPIYVLSDVDLQEVEGGNVGVLLVLSAAVAVVSEWQAAKEGFVEGFNYINNSLKREGK